MRDQGIKTYFSQRWIINSSWPKKRKSTIPRINKITFIVIRVDRLLNVKIIKLNNKWSIKGLTITALSARKLSRELMIGWNKTIMIRTCLIINWAVMKSLISSRRLINGRPNRNWCNSIEIGCIKRRLPRSSNILWDINWCKSWLARCAPAKKRLP